MSLFSYSRNYKMISHIFLRDPDRYAPIIQFTETVMRKDSELTPDERELIAAYVSALNACEFCFGAHEAVAKAYGVDSHTIKSLRDDPDNPAVDPRMRPILKLVRKLTESPAKVVQSDIDAVTNAGWSEQTVEDAICVASIFAFFNRIADGFGIGASADVFAMIDSEVAPGLYEPMFQSGLATQAT